MPCRDVNVALVARLNNITFACEELWTVIKDPEGNGFCVS
jgi:hypothetical protein